LQSYWLRFFLMHTKLQIVKGLGSVIFFIQYHMGLMFKVNRNPVFYWEIAYKLIVLLQSYYAVDKYWNKTLHNIWGLMKQKSQPNVRYGKTKVALNSWFSTFAILLNLLWEYDLKTSVWLVVKIEDLLLLHCILFSLSSSIVSMTENNFLLSFHCYIREIFEFKTSRKLSSFSLW